MHTNHNSPARVSLEQWRALQAVIDHGGFAQAAEHLHRSQSSVSYAVNRLQELLGLKLLHIKGRKAVLTEQGRVLLQRSRQLVADAAAIEQQARNMAQGWEAEIHLAVEAAYPTDLLMQALRTFEPQNPSTRIHLQEVVLSGGEDLLLNGKADLLISPFVPAGYLGNELLQVQFVAVAHPQHPLHQLGRTLSARDLNRETHIITSDSGSKGTDAGWLSDARRWAVTSMETARKLICNGLGYGWLPQPAIRDQINAGTLKPLPLEEGQSNHTAVYLVYADADKTGPATRQLAEILKQVSASLAE